MPLCPHLGVITLPKHVPRVRQGRNSSLLSAKAFHTFQCNTGPVGLIGGWTTCALFCGFPLTPTLWHKAFILCATFTLCTPEQTNARLSSWHPPPDHSIKLPEKFMPQASLISINILYTSWITCHSSSVNNINRGSATEGLVAYCAIITLFLMYDFFVMSDFTIY